MAASADLFCETWHLLNSLLEETAPELVKLGLYPRALILLTRIKRCPYPAQLAEALLIPAPTVSFILKQFEQQGLIAREIDRADLRRYRFTLTKRGAGALDKGQKILARHAARRLARLTKAEQVKFRSFLRTLGAAATPARGRAQ